jgi:hypothetical protein
MRNTPEKSLEVKFGQKINHSRLVTQKYCQLAPEDQNASCRPENKSENVSLEPMVKSIQTDGWRKKILSIQKQ